MRVALDTGSSRIAGVPIGVNLAMQNSASALLDRQAHAAFNIKSATQIWG